MERYLERRSLIKRKQFIEALTVGSCGKPIELHFNVPVRYVNDILAWLHEAFANEFDLLDLLLPDMSIGEKRDYVANILIIAIDFAKAYMFEAIDSIETLSIAFNVLLLVSYYEEWFLKHTSDPKVPELLSDITLSANGKINALLSGLYDLSLSDHVNPAVLLLPPGLERMVQEFIHIENIRRHSLGPSDALELVSNLKGNLIEMLLKQIRLHINNLEENEVSILSLNAFSQIELNLNSLPALLEDSHDTALQLLVTKYFNDLLESLKIPTEIKETVSADEMLRYLTLLSNLLVEHNGWDWTRQETRIVNVKHRQLIASRASELYFRFYQSLWDLIPADTKTDYKSPEVIRQMLS